MRDMTSTPLMLVYPLSPKCIHIPTLIIRILTVPWESGTQRETLRSKYGKQQGGENVSLQGNRLFTVEKLYKIVDPIE